MLTIVVVVLRTFYLCRDKLTNVYRIVRKCTILIFSDCLSFSFQFMYICFRSSASIINIIPLNPSHSYIVVAMLNVWQKEIKVSSRNYLEYNLTTVRLQSNLIMWSHLLKCHLCCPIVEHFIWIKTLLRGHLSYKDTSYVSQRWLLNVGLTLFGFQGDT
jgi:hypothetical protein